MSRVGKLINIAVLITFVLASGTASAEIFKWVDGNGKVHYSDRKTDSSAEKLNVTTGTTSLGQSSQDVEQRMMQQKKFLNYLQSERLDRKEKRAKEENQKAKLRKYCATLQDQLKSYTEDHVNWYDFDEETGERRYLSDSELEKLKQDLRAEIKSSCS